MKRQLNNKELGALREMRNFLMHQGRFPSVRELMTSLHYKSPRSASLLLDKLISKKVLKKKQDGSFQLMNLDDLEITRAQTVDVPLLGNISCGVPILAVENIDAMVPVSVKLARPPYKYFLLRAHGDSMNEKGINDGDMVLVKQQNSANNGDVVVALIDDEATIKEFHKHNDAIVLMPRSTNKTHQPIVLTTDFKVQGIVISAIPTII